MGLLDTILDPETIAAVKQLNEPSEEQMRQARNNALMNAGFSMMINNGGMSKSQALFNALGNGGMAGMNSYAQSVGDAREQNNQQLQQALAVRKIMEEQKQKQAQQAAIAQLPQADQQAILAGVPYKEMWQERNKGYTLSPGDQRFVGGQQVAGLAAKPELKEGYLVSDGNGGWKVDPQLFALTKELKATSAPKVSVSPVVNVGNKFGETVAKAGADRLMSQVEAASAAPKTITSGQQILSALDSGKVLAGPGTTWKIAAKQMFGDDEGKLIQTRNVIQGLAQLALDSRQSLAGQGPITEGEQAMLKQAVSGDIDKMTVGEMRLIANSAIKNAQQTHAQGKRAAAALGGMPEFQQISPAFNIPDLPEIPAVAPAGAVRLKR